MDQKKQQLELMETIKALNEEIVCARKQGNANTVSMLKQQVQDLLTSAMSPNAKKPLREEQTPSVEASTPPASRTPLASIESPPPNIEKKPASSPMKARKENAQKSSQKDLMKALYEVNQQITEARKKGEHTRVQVLKQKAADLMQQALVK